MNREVKIEGISAQENAALQASKSTFFAAIDKYIERNIVLPTEKDVKQCGYDMVEWGPNDMYPFYLMGLYKDSVTLHSIISGCVDYLAGDDVVFSQA